MIGIMYLEITLQVNQCWTLIEHDHLCCNTFQILPTVGYIKGTNSDLTLKHISMNT